MIEASAKQRRYLTRHDILPLDEYLLVRREWRRRLSELV